MYKAHKKSFTMTARTSLSVSNLAVPAEPYNYNLLSVSKKGILEQLQEGTDHNIHYSLLRLTFPTTYLKVYSNKTVHIYNILLHFFFLILLENS